MVIHMRPFATDYLVGLVLSFFARKKHDDHRDSNSSRANERTACHHEPTRLLVAPSALLVHSLKQSTWPIGETKK